MKLTFEHEEEPKMKKIIKEVIIWTVEIVIVILLAYFLVNKGAAITTMVGNSMENTLKNDDKILVNRFIYRFTKPDRFDIIAYKQNGSEQGYYTLKRIIGIPGDTIQIIDGAVMINGEKIEEPMEVEPMVNGGLAGVPITLEENEYFVLGDNRNNCEDSRFANVGLIVFDDILGKAWIRMNQFTFLKYLNVKEVQK